MRKREKATDEAFLQYLNNDAAADNDDGDDDCTVP